jgi:NAD(P)-dependent dehydrogenase (short-subunit alcohol dehydrogenase family)
MTTTIELYAGVTGGCMGIGYAYVESLLLRGYNIVIFDISNSDQCLCNLTNKFPDKSVRLYNCDVGDTVSFEAAFYKSLSDYNIITYDLFVCNAGIMRGMFVDIDKQIQTNLMGTIRGVEMVIKSATNSLTQRSSKPIAIVCTASTNGIIPADCDMAPIYIASKFAIVGFVRSLKFLSSRYNIRVNAICPVTVETPMVSGLITPEISLYLQQENRGGILKPSDCAEALLRIIDDNSIYGEIVTVHPNAGPGGKVENLDLEGRFNYLGLWREENSEKTKEFVDAGFDAIRDGSTQAFGTS